MVRSLSTSGRTKWPAIALSASLAVAIFAALAFQAQFPENSTSDFYSFWAGARLVGPDLYNVSKADAIQQGVTPLTKINRYIRPPFYALMLWPLGRLPFHTAYACWFLLNAAAAIAFVWAWKFEPEAYVACAFFLPLAWSFGLEQDAPLMLLILAVGARLIEGRMEWAGGAVLALLSIKPHLFLFVPVVLAAQRRVRAFGGALAGGVFLYLVSSARLGLDWPVAFIHAAVGNELSIHPRLLGIAAMAARFNAPKWLLFVSAVAGAAVVYRKTRSESCSFGLAFATAAGLVFAPRSMIYDASLFLPLLLLEFSPWMVDLVGVLLILIVTPAAWAGELVSIGILFWPGHKGPKP